VLLEGHLSRAVETPAFSFRPGRRRRPTTLEHMSGPFGRIRPCPATVLTRRLNRPPEWRRTAAMRALCGTGGTAVVVDALPG
jgi:hypothetical protein